MKVARFVIAAFAVSSAAALANDNASSPSSDNVSQVQQALKQKGFDPGPADGKMGPKTESALKQFQQSQQISASGQADQQTLSALGVEGGSSSTGSSSGTSPSSGSSMSGNSSSSMGNSSSPSSSSGSTSPSSSSGSSDTSQQAK